MPSPITYNFLYVVNGFQPNGMTPIGGQNVFSITLTDSQDGANDSSTSVGDTIAWNFGGSPSSTPELVGLTPAGDPVLFDGSSAYLLSNTAGLGPGTIQTNTTGGFQYCFLTGTQIATPEGEQPVEDLQIGDLITTSDGRIVPVKWLGRQTVATRFAKAERLMPVRLAAGSLGQGLPHSDLTVTADHALLIDGVLCNASALVNGTTITRVPLAEMGADYTVFHIETEAHEIILANGAPAETFIDNVSRRVFDNYADYHALYGDEAEMQELPLPRATSARQVPKSVHALLRSNQAA